jgi:hypothetical protein
LLQGKLLLAVERWMLAKMLGLLGKMLWPLGKWPLAKLISVKKGKFQTENDFCPNRLRNLDAISDGK